MYQLRIFIFIIFLILISCSKNKHKNNQSDNITNPKINVKNISVDYVYKDTLVGIPCTELQKFAKELKQLNWIPDHQRLKNVGIYDELQREKVAYFNGYPFYPINFENSRLNHTLKQKKYSDGLDIQLFKKVKCIWGYYYRKKELSELNPDGIIEQWEFETEAQAKQALKQFNKLKYIVYFNTNPYCSSIKNRLIIFQTRAMAFSYEQRSLFEKFNLLKE